MVSSVSDFVRSSKSEILVRPRDPVVSVFGRLIVTVFSSSDVQGGVFRTREFVATVGGVVTG
jgi:hypothetical protein